MVPQRLQYVTETGEQIYHSSGDEFPVMLIAEDICGRRLGLCQHAVIDIGLAPLDCRICSTWVTDINRRTVGTSADICSQ